MVGSIENNNNHSRQTREEPVELDIEQKNSGGPSGVRLPFLPSLFHLAGGWQTNASRGRGVARTGRREARRVLCAQRGGR